MLDLTASLLLAFGVSSFVKSGVDILASAFTMPSGIKPLIAFGLALLFCFFGYFVVPTNLATMQAVATIVLAAATSTLVAVGMTELQKNVTEKKAKGAIPC